MLRVIYNLTTKEIAVVLWAEGETLYNQQINGMVQGDINTTLYQCTSIGIPIQPVIAFLNDHEIPTAGLLEKAGVTLKQNFGQALLLEFFAGTASMALPLELYKIATDTFHYAEVALRRGDIAQARQQLDNISAFPPIWTQESKDYFLTKIDEFLNSLEQ